VGKSLLTVRRWRRPYVAKGVDGLLKDATRRSHVKPLTPEKIRQGGGHDAVCEATQRDAVERAQLGRGGSRVLTAVFGGYGVPTGSSRT
jgi:hypothetical protein